MSLESECDTLIAILGLLSAVDAVNGETHLGLRADLRDQFSECIGFAEVVCSGRAEEKSPAKPVPNLCPAGVTKSAGFAAGRDHPVDVSRGAWTSNASPESSRSADWHQEF